MKFSNQSARRSGFSLSELMVVISLIAVLTALIMPAIQGVRTRTKQARCANNLRQIGQGLLMYASDRGTLPHCSHYDFWADWCDTILPYMISGRYVYYPGPWQNGLWQDQSNGEYLDRDYTQAQYSNANATGWSFFTCPAGPTSPDSLGNSRVRYPHHYGANELYLTHNYNGYMVKNRSIPPMKLSNIERPGSVILACDTGPLDPYQTWGGGDASDSCFQPKLIITSDFESDPTGAPTRGETVVSTPAANNVDTVDGNGWPVYSRHNGVCNAIMADGHVEIFRNGEIRRKNWASKRAQTRLNNDYYTEIWYP